MLRIIESFNNLPIQATPNPDLICQPGHFASFQIKNGTAVISLSDGVHPYGIIDDIRSDVIRKVTESWETYIVPATDIEYNKYTKDLYTEQSLVVELKNKNIIASSFTSDIYGKLDSAIGTLTIPSGTMCNYTLPGSTTNNSLKFKCKYAYNIKLSKFEDSTIGTNKITIWNKNMIADTDMFDTTQEYVIGKPLYVAIGLLTTKRNDYVCPAVGSVLKSPSDNSGYLRFVLDLNGKIEVGGASQL
jgi:hypothetical protein